MAGQRPTPLVAGNWKMNGMRAELETVREIAEAVRARRPACQVMLCPPATLLMAAAEALRGSPVQLGAQDCHAEPAGAFTGDLSAEMLKDAGAGAVIVGHSERRTGHGENHAAIRAKAAAAHRAGLVAIVCIGETLAEREAGHTLAVLDRQLDGALPAGATAANTVIAYEPVWAIGTGVTPSREDAGMVHRHIRRRLAESLGREGEGVRILYGGSVKPENASTLLLAPDIDGALVGGASLKAKDFLGIVDIYA